MIVPAQADVLVTAFSKSVTTMLNGLVEKCEWIDKNDPDPERTKGHEVDRTIRKWFGQGGGLGY